MPGSKASLFDICANKHGGNAESIEANAKASMTKDWSRQAILDVLHSWGPMTCKELSVFLVRPMHCVAGRLSEMKRDGRVQPTGERRDGGMVVRAI